MPVIFFEGPKLPLEKKAEMIKGFTEVANGVLPRIPKEAFVVILKENHIDNVGVGGELLSVMKKRHREEAG